MNTGIFMATIVCHNALHSQIWHFLKLCTFVKQHQAQYKLSFPETLLWLQLDMCPISHYLLKPTLVEIRTKSMKSGGQEM